MNVLSTAGLTSDPVEVREWRLRQEVSDVETVRGQLGTATATLAALRQEVLDAEAALTALGPVPVPTLQADGANRRVLEHATLTMGGQTAEAWTGWERHGVLVRDGSLVTVGSSSGQMTTVEQPQGTDNIVLRFTTPQTDLRAVRLRPLVSGQTMTGEAWVITGTGTVIKSNFSSINGGSVPLPVHNSVSYVVVVWRSGGGYSLDAIERAAPADPVRQAAESRVTAARANEQVGLATLQPDALRVRLREELSDVVFGAAQFGVGVPTTVSSGQELVSVTPTAQAWAPNGVELAFRFTDLAGSYDLLQNGNARVRFNAGTSTLTIPYDGSASLGNWSLRNVATGATTSLDLLVTRNVQSGVFSFLKQSNSQAYGTQSITTLTGLVSRPVLTAERFNMGGVGPTTQSAVNALLGSDLSWLQNVPLTASELSAGRDRLSAGTANDVATLRTALLARPGVEAVVTPSLTFQTGWNMTGQHTLTVSGSDLPDGSRLVLASDAGLTQVLDERSLLAGSDGVTMLRGSATFVGLVDASGQVLGQPFSLANESGWLTVRQGQTLVGQPNTTLPATALAGVLNPVTKDCLQSVTPSVRFVTSGSSVDLRYEWLPVGAVITLTNPIDGTVSAPVTVTSRTGNLPLYLPANQGRILHVKASDGRQLFRPMGVMRGSAGQASFYELDPPGNRWVAVLELTSERTLATREEARGVEAGRSTVLPRRNAVSVSADMTTRRNWGAALGELAGIGLSLSEREIARRHLPTLIGANPAEDCTLILAEINRLTALPGSNSRGWNERFVLSQVSDAYARAREDIKAAWPIFCEMIVAGFQVVQSTRTDAANVTPVSAIEQTRNAFAQSGQLLHLLPSAQTILGCLNQHFDRCHTFLASAATTWQQEVDAASQAGSITRDPNPGLRLPDSPQQRAYDAALSAFGDAERLHRQAVVTGVARYISAASVTLERSRVTLQQAELALRGANTAATPAQLTKQTLENGDVVTVMNRAALQHLLAGLPGKIAAAEQRLQAVTSPTLRVSLQTELTHWQTLRTAAQGLLALIPAGQTVPTLSTASAREWVKYIEKTTTDPTPTRNWGRVENGARLEGAAGLWSIVAEGGLAKADFEIAEEKMVNIWIDYHTGADLRLLDARGVEVWAPRIRTGSDGESFSGVLAPGAYRVEVTSEAFEQTLPVRRSMLLAALHLEVVPRSRKQIVGRVSREGSPEVMPVRMSVAEFEVSGESAGMRKSIETVDNLDPAKPVWVVIHGMYNNDGQSYPDADFDDTMHLLAKSMAGFGRLSDTQVVTIDWHEAARDNHFLGPLQDATWTERIGAWVGSQLLNLGFPPSKINIAGFSHGTYVSYFAAKKIQEAGSGSVQSIIALDPATNVGFLNGNGTIDASSIRFSEVANTSVALKASITQEVTFSSDPLSIPAQIAALSPYHQIEFGSDARALTAHHSFNLLVGGQTDQSRVHNFPVTAFSRMVQDVVAGHPNGLAQSVLNPFNLLTRIDGAGLVTKSSYDGVVRAVGALDHRQSGVAWAHALPVDILLRDGTHLDLEDHLYDPLP